MNDDELLSRFGIDIDDGTVAPPQTFSVDPSKCKPHDWRLPVVGDEALLCERCGRTMPFWTLRPDHRASIINSIRNRCGENDYQAFSHALYAAARAVVDAHHHDFDAFRERMETGPVVVAGRKYPVRDGKRRGRYSNPSRTGNAAEAPIPMQPRRRPVPSR